jgi:hemerythrin superfamily protein
VSTKSTIEEAAKTVGKVFSPNTNPESKDILTTLKQEHEEVKSLLSDLQEAESAEERTELVQSIKAALVPHTKAEEKVVYDAIIGTAEEQAETDGLEGYWEHELAAKTLERLEQADPTSPEHKATAKVLKGLVEHHIKEEESSVWGDVKEHFDDDDRAAMNVAFEIAKQSIKV